MSDYSLTVKKNDGLTQILKRQAEAQGYNTDNIKIQNWNEVMNIFDKIQQQKKAQGQPLFSGGNERTKNGWHKNYVIQTGQKIKLSENEMAELFKAMGFTGAAATLNTSSTTTNPTVATTPLTTPFGEIGGCREEDTKFSSGNVSGTYNICSGEDGTGYRLLNETKIEGEAEAKKFFNKTDYDENTKEFSVRGIKGTEEHTVETQAEAKSQELSVQTAIYKDLNNKKTAGTTLSKQEESFMAEHPKALYKVGLQLNEQNDIISSEVKGCNEEETRFSSGNVSGTYNLCTGEDGTGHRLLSNLEIHGEGEASKFFKTDSYDEKTKEYSIRNIKGTDEATVKAQAEAQARRLSVNTGVYKHLNDKKTARIALSVPEQSFMKEHTKSLKEAGLQLNEQNEIVEIPVEPAKKGFFKKLFGG